MINKKYMKHLLNDLSEHEKNHIREQHTDKIKIDTSKFRKLMESKLGDVKPISEQKSNQAYRVGQTLMGKRSTDNQMYEIKIVQLVNDGGHVVAKIKGPGKYEGNKLDGVTGSWELNTTEPGKLSGNMQMGTFEILNNPSPSGKLTEQEIGGPKRNIEKDLERDDVLHLMDKNNSKDEAIVLQSPQPNQGLLVNHKGKKTQFVFGPANNQIRFAGKTEPGDFDFTIDSVEINGKSFPVSSDGSF